MSSRAIDFSLAQNLCETFFAQATRFGEAPFLWSKHQGRYAPLSWQTVRLQVEQAARGFQTALNLPEQARVVIVSDNRPEWCIADLAIMAAGGITVPAYTTNTISDHLHILHDSEASLVICSGKVAPKVMQAATQLAKPPRFVFFDPEEIHQNPGVDWISWEDLLRAGMASEHPLPGLHATPKQTACLIYTSGTGGAPKGVMLSHGAILHNCLGAHEVIKMLDLGEQIFLSFLPLSHAYEHTAGQFFPITIGAQIAYAESLDALATNMQEIRPTIMTAVPRLYEVLRQKILRGVDRQGGRQAAWFHRTVHLGSKAFNGSLSFPEHLLNLLCGLLVRRKVKQRFGGRLKAFVSGGAPLNADIGSFFTALGVRILQGYGQTEAAPVISVTLPSRIRSGAVGPAMKGVELKIADDGEICVRGPMVMNGYWNNPTATAQVLDADGWLHTGDIGEITDEGDLRITDRKKDIIVNSGGDNLSPQRVEGFLTLESDIAQAMVFGDGRPHLVALIVPEQTLKDRLYGTPEALHQTLWQAVSRVNQTLSPLEKIRAIAVADDQFTIDNGMLTPTLKLRRHIILKTYRGRLEALYREKAR